MHYLKFKCSKCGAIEKHSCVNVKHLQTEYQIYQHHIPGEMIDDVYPKMSLIDMQGHSDEDIIVNGNIFKKKNEIMMLCSKCNTGEWHNEFNREEATEEESEVAHYSKYNYTTPADHSVKLIECDSNPSGYKVKKISKKDKDGKLFLAAVSIMVDLEAIVKASIGDKKPHWKALQSEHERNSRLEKAELKRLRKRTLNKKG